MKAQYTITTTKNGTITAENHTAFVKIIDMILTNDDVDSWYVHNNKCYIDNGD